MLKLLKILIKSSCYGDGYTATIVDSGIIAQGNTEDETLDKAIHSIDTNIKYDVVDINVVNAGIMYTIQY